MASYFYGATALTGGGFGALDAIDGNDISDGDGAIVIDAASNKTYYYTCNSSSGATESSPFIISPDTNAGTKRWILTKTVHDGMTHENTFVVDPNESDQGIAGDGRSIYDIVDTIGTSESATIVLTHNGSGNTTTYTLTTSETIPSNITLRVENGAILDGVGTLTINGPFEAGLHQVFGSSITIVFGEDVEKWIEWWGAVGDDPGDGTGTDNQAAVTAALSQVGQIRMGGGTFRIDGALTLTNAANTNTTIQGLHRYKSGFIFSDSTVAACFNGIQAGATLVDHFTFKDLTITGPGKAAGSSVHGVAIYNSAADSDNPFDINFENVLIEKLSGHAIYIPKLWNSTIRKVRCDAIGGSGIVVGANPAVLIEGSDYHDDIDGAAIWVIDGKPVLLNNNIGDVLQGMKFGRTATDFASPYNTATYAYPTIIGANIEGIRANGEGIYFNSGSFPHHLSNVMIYTGSGVTVDYGIYIHYYGSANSQSFLHEVQFVEVGGGSFTEKIYVNLSAATSGGFIYFGPTSDISSNGHTPRVVVPLQIRRNVSNATLEIHADIQTDGIIYDIGTLANDATPSIDGGSVWITGGTTTITDFDDGVTGQVITILAEHTITITDGTNIFLNGSTNFDMTDTDTLTLICKADNKWYELSRGDNGA